MACPNCGCKVHYQFNSEDDFAGDDERLERCAACGAVFDIEDAADDETSPSIEREVSGEASADGVPGGLHVNPACGVHGPIPCEGPRCICTPGVKAHAAPQGWKLVPINPTPDMLKAGMDRNGDVIRVGDGQGVPAELWRDMLNAAPEPPSSPDAWAWEEVPEQRCEHGVPWGSDCTTCGVALEDGEVKR